MTDPAPGKSSSAIFLPSSNLSACMYDAHMLKYR
jgi:hypothetical protein